MAINGKSLEAVFSEFKKESTVKKELRGKYWYYPIHAYVGRMNEVLGEEHYRTEYSDFWHVQLSSGQSVIYCKCTVSFIDDEGKVCHVVSGLGSFELTFSSDKGAFIMLDNSGLRLQQQAFKSVCKSLQFFNEREDEHPAAPNQKDTSQQKNSANKEENKDKPEPRAEVFYTTGEFIILKEDTKAKKPIYKVYGYRKVGAVMEDTPSAIVFYPNLYKPCTGQLNNMIALCKDGKQHKLSVTVTPSEYKEDNTPQFVFRKFN